MVDRNSMTMKILCNLNSIVLYVLFNTLVFRKGKIVMKIHVKSHNNNFPSYVQLKLYVTIFKVKLNKKN